MKRIKYLGISSFQFSSVAQSCSTLCNPMNLSTPGLPVHHQLPEFTQTHVHRVSDAIQPSHPLLSPSPPAPQSLPASDSFPINLLKETEDLYIENYKTLIKKIKDDTNRSRNIPCLWTGRINILK